jgi:hypothetical protein
MKGVFAVVLSATLIANLTAQDQSAKETEAFDIEPEILPQNLKDDAALEKSTAPAPTLDVAKLEKDLDRAKGSAANAEHLYKIGVLAKVEAEMRLLKVVRIESDLENARLAQAKTEMLSRQNQDASDSGGEGKTNGAKTDGDPGAVAGSAEVVLARAIEAAHAAAAKRERAELEQAEINLRRQQKLLSLGSGHKSDVARAERKLSELKQATAGQ